MKLTIGHHVELEGLTDEQYHAFCEKAIKDGAKQGEYDHGSWDYVGIDEHNKIMLYNNYFSRKYPQMQLTIDQALSEGDGLCHYPNKHKDLFDVIAELKVIKSQIAKLQEREAELSKIIADDLELG